MTKAVGIVGVADYAKVLWAVFVTFVV